MSRQRRAALLRLLLGGVAVIAIATAACGTDGGTEPPGPPTEIVVLTGPPATVENGAELSQHPVVEVRDADGDVLVAETVTASIASGSGVLGGTTTNPTDDAGQAVFDDLSITGAVGAYTIRFEAGSASAVSQAIALEAGPAATLTILTPPSSVSPSGALLAQQPVVEVEDASGNPVPGSTVTASIASGDGSLEGTKTASTDDVGRAVFADLSVSGAVGAYTIRFEAGSASAVSEAIELGPGAAATLTILTPPSSASPSGAVLAQQPVVEVEDASGNPVSGSTVTASIASGEGSLAGDTTASTDDAGRAVFAELSISGAIGPYTIRFDAGSASAVSEAIELAAGPAATLTILAPPSSASPSGAVFAQQPVVEVEDASGNPVSGTTVTASIASGDGSLGGDTTVTVDPSGVASFQNLSISGTVGVRTLRFAVGATGATSGPISLTPGPVAQLVITQQPSSNVVNGAQLPRQPRVRALDEWSNAIDGVSVVATIASGEGTLSGTTAVTSNSAAEAVFTNLSVMGTVGAHTLRFASGAESVTSSSVHVAYGEGFYADIQYCGSHEAQRMDVSVPSNAYERPLPVAAYIHGGGWNGGDKSRAPNLDRVRNELLDRGYVVVSLNYRLGRTAKWPAQIQDVKCAIRHLRSQAADYGLDPDMVGAWGGSAGGHLSAMLALTDASAGFEGNGGYAGFSSRVNAAAPFGTISDMTEPWASQGHPELHFPGPESTFLTWPGPSAELDEASPIRWASSDDAPLLMLHGEEDTTVLPAQATRLRDALQAVGADVTLQIVLNGGHNLEDVGSGTPVPSLSQSADLIADFFDQHLRGVAP